MKKLLLNLICLLLAATTLAQEFNCQIQINTPKLRTTDPKVFQTLETAIQEFMNDTKWTDDAFEPHERIDVNINLNITEELSSTSFSCRLFCTSYAPYLRQWRANGRIRTC